MIYHRNMSRQHSSSLQTALVNNSLITVFNPKFFPEKILSKVHHNTLDLLRIINNLVSPLDLRSPAEEQKLNLNVNALLMNYKLEKPEPHYLSSEFSRAIS